MVIGSLLCRADQQARSFPALCFFPEADSLWRAANHCILCEVAHLGRRNRFPYFFYSKLCTDTMASHDRCRRRSTKVGREIINLYGHFDCSRNESRWGIAYEQLISPRMGISCSSLPLEGMRFAKKNKHIPLTAEVCFSSYRFPGLSKCLAQRVSGRSWKNE